MPELNINYLTSALYAEHKKSKLLFPSLIDVIVIAQLKFSIEINKNSKSMNYHKHNTNDIDVLFQMKVSYFSISLKLSQIFNSAQYLISTIIRKNSISVELIRKTWETIVLVIHSDTALSVSVWNIWMEVNDVFSFGWMATLGF